MIPRWVHRLYAFLAGYFWLPCPACGRMFGGHEGRASHVMWNEDHTRGQVLCPKHDGDITV